MASDLERRSTLSGLTEGEAKEFNRIFVISFLIFVGIAIIAHILAWAWRPWLPGVHGYQTSMLLDHPAVHGLAAMGAHAASVLLT
jgi:light-harvesting complex 1 beta chain